MSKWFDAEMLSFLVISLLWLLSFILNWISDFPTYHFLHFKQSGKYIKVFEAFNNVSAVLSSFKKYLGVYLDKQLNFPQHI